MEAAQKGWWKAQKDWGEAWQGCKKLRSIGEKLKRDGKKLKRDWEKLKSDGEKLKRDEEKLKINKKDNQKLACTQSKFGFFEISSREIWKQKRLFVLICTSRAFRHLHFA